MLDLTCTDINAFAVVVASRYNNFALGTLWLCLDARNPLKVLHLQFTQRLST